MRVSLVECLKKNLKTGSLLIKSKNSGRKYQKRKVSLIILNFIILKLVLKGKQDIAGSLKNLNLNDSNKKEGWLRFKFIIPSFFSLIFLSSKANANSSNKYSSNIEKV